MAKRTALNLIVYAQGLEESQRLNGVGDINGELGIKESLSTTG